jgi:HK97 family phage major capsid protein
MGTNGAALADYAKLVDAIQSVLEGNGAAVGAVYSPRTAGALAKLEDTTGQPLRMPKLVEDLRHRTSTRIPNDLVQGTASNASAAFLGDFSQVAYGVRNEITLEVSRDAGESFERARVLVRAYLRADVNTLRPKHLCRIVGIIP